MLHVYLNMRYVIASCASANRRNLESNWFLQAHLKSLLLYDCHLITDVVVMIPDYGREGHETFHDQYYDIDAELKDLEKHKGINTLKMSCQNMGCSNGQWLHYLHEHPLKPGEFCICAEDDYCPSRHDFDVEFKECHQTMFPDGIGNLSSIVQGRPRHPEHVFSEHYEGIFIFNEATVQKLIDHWNPTTLMGLRDLVHYDVIDEQPQLSFSAAMTQSGIPHEDFLSSEKGYTFIYWKDPDKLIVFDRPFLTTDEITRVDHSEITLPLRKQSLILPVQLIRQCTIVLSSHRCGSSMTAGILHHLGIEGGKSLMLDHKDVHNTRGYYENKRILDFNTKVLAAIGRTWLAASHLNSDEMSVVFTYKEELKLLIKDEFGNALHIFIKDPRCIQLWHLYNAALTELFIGIAPVIVRRDEESAVKSLCTAQHIGEADARTLYQYLYSQAKRLIVQKRSNVLTHAHDVVNDPNEFISRLEKLLVYTFPKNKRSKAMQSVDKKLLHMPTTTTPTSIDKGIIRSSYNTRDLTYGTLIDVLCTYALDTDPSTTKRAIEFGVLDGYSTNIIAEHVHQLTAYDIFEEFQGNHAKHSIASELQSNVELKYGDFYDDTLFDAIEDKSMDLIHIDIANTGDVYKQVPKWLKKIKDTGLLILEGGSTQRDDVGWMIKYNKPPIHEQVEILLKEGYDGKTIGEFPSLTVFRP